MAKISVGNMFPEHHEINNERKVRFNGVLCIDKIRRRRNDVGIQVRIVGGMKHWAIVLQHRFTPHDLSKMGKHSLCIEKMCGTWCGFFPHQEILHNVNPRFIRKRLGLIQNTFRQTIATHGTCHGIGAKMHEESHAIESMFTRKFQTRVFWALRARNIWNFEIKNGWIFRYGIQSDTTDFLCVFGFRQKNFHFFMISRMKNGRN